MVSLLKERNEQVSPNGSLACGKAQWFVLLGVAMSPWWGSASPACGASAGTTVWGLPECLICWPGISRINVSVLGDGLLM